MKKIWSIFEIQGPAGPISKCLITEFQNTLNYNFSMYIDVEFPKYFENDTKNSQKLLSQKL